MSKLLYGGIASLVLLLLLMLFLVGGQRKLLQTRLDQPSAEVVPAVEVSVEQCELSYHECLVCYGAHPDTEYWHHCSQQCLTQREACFKNPQPPDPQTPVVIDPDTSLPHALGGNPYDGHH